MAGATTITVTSGGGDAEDITFTSTINDAVAGQTNLTLNAGTSGDVSVGDAIGGVRAIGNFTVTNAAQTDLNNVIADNIAVKSTNIDLNGATYTVAEGGDVTFDGPVNLNLVGGTTTVTGGLLAGDQILFKSTVNDDVAGKTNLKLVAGLGWVDMQNAVGGVRAIGNFTVENAGLTDLNNVIADNIAVTSTIIDLNATTYTTNAAAGNATFTGAVGLWDAVTVDTSAGTGDVHFTSTVENNGHLLTVNTDGAASAIDGVMSGSGGLTKKGTGVLSLSNGNTYSGVTTINGGTVRIGADSGLGTILPYVATPGQLVFDGGTLQTTATMTLDSNRGVLLTGAGTFSTDNSTTLTYGGIVDGVGLLTKIGGGSLVLSGANLYSGGTTISGGTLQANNISALGTGFVTNNATLDVGAYDVAGIGKYTQTATTSIFRVTVDSATTSGSLTSTTADAKVNTLGSVVVTNNVYVPNARTFTIIDSTGGTEVEVPGTITKEGTGRSDWNGSASNGDLMITSDRSAHGFASTATDSNARNVGQVLDNVNNPTSDMTNVLNTLEGSSDAQVASALDTMYPDMSSGSLNASRASTSQFLGSVSDRLGQIRGGSSGVATGGLIEATGFWTQALGSFIKQDARGGIEGYKANLFGTAIGVDKLIGDFFRAGFAGGYGYAKVKSKTAGSPSDSINSMQFALYGSFDSINLSEARKAGHRSRVAARSQGQNSWYIDGMMGFTQNFIDSKRGISFSGNNRTASADHDSQQYSTGFESGYTLVFDKTKALEVTPFVGLAYNYLYMDKYSESGADALNLSVNGKGYNELLQTLGTKLAYPLISKKIGTFIPAVKAAWMYDYIGDRFKTTASFAGGGSSFTTQGANPAKNGFLMGAELTFLNKGNMTVRGNWDIELKDQYMSNTYYGTVRYDF